MARGEATYAPVPITMGILADIGWKNLKIDFTTLFVVYSADSFASQPDSLPLMPAGNNLFEGQLLPAGNTDLNYYISAGDIKNRTFRKPSEVPGEFF